MGKHLKKKEIVAKLPEITALAAECMSQPDIARIIGISTHNLEQFKNAHAMDCDYLAYGPIFKTQTKAYHIGMDGITDILAIAAKPVVFIGGINMKNIDHVLAEGAKNIAMIRAIMQADDIEGITRQYKQEIIKRQV